MSKKKIKGFLFSIACARSIKQERKCLLRGQSFQVEGGRGEMKSGRNSLKYR